MSITIGIELEFGVLDGDGVPRVAGNFMTHDKLSPLNIDGILFHKDASMLEIAFPPCSSQAELDAVVLKGIRLATDMLPEGWTLTNQAALEYSDEELAVDPYASEMGCSPSDNLYGMAAMPGEYPDNVRYAGMHVNVGGDQQAFSPDFIFALDLLLAAPHVAHLVASGDTEALDALRTRRIYYGRAGEYRPRPFGVEYRTLPVSAYPLLGHNLFTLVQQAIALDHANHGADIMGIKATIQLED